jgi:hypothetical protein
MPVLSPLICIWGRAADGPGTLAPHGKLREEDVWGIWAERPCHPSERTVTMAQLGARYCVSGPMIRHIVHRKCWKACKCYAANP